MAHLLHIRVRCDEVAPTAVRQEMRNLPGLGEALDDASLVANELVTNAVQHSLCTEDEFVSVRISRNPRRN